MSIYPDRPKGYNGTIPATYNEDIPIIAIDQNSKETKFPNIAKAARTLNLYHRSVFDHINTLDKTTNVQKQIRKAKGNKPSGRKRGLKSSDGNTYTFKKDKDAI